MKRFWDKVDTSGECWVWTASVNNRGYGKFGLNYKTVLPHRLSYELCVGAIPEGLEIDHECKNRRCVNPAHLRPKTHLDNTPKGADHYNARKTHCKNGHEFSAGNTRLRDGKYRVCKSCERDR